MERNKDYETVNMKYIHRKMVVKHVQKPLINS